MRDRSRWSSPIPNRFSTPVMLPLGDGPCHDQEWANVPVYLAFSRLGHRCRGSASHCAHRPRNGGRERKERQMSTASLAPSTAFKGVLIEDAKGEGSGTVVHV